MPELWHKRISHEGAILSIRTQGRPDARRAAELSQWLSFDDNGDGVSSMEARCPIQSERTKTSHFLAVQTSPASCPEFQSNMATNDTETSTISSNRRSVITCLETSNLTSDLTETTIPWIVFPITIIASLFTILLNALVIIAMRKKREVKKTSTILLSSMAVADLLVGAISMPLTVAADILIIRQVYYSGFCALRVATEYSMFPFAWSSLYHLTLIAWERFVAICKWVDYKVIVTKGRLNKLATVSWLVAAFTSFPPLVMLAAGAGKKIKEAWYIGESVVAVICLILVGYFYIMVYIGVHKRRKNGISQATGQDKAKLESKVAMTCAFITVGLIASFFGVIIVAGLGEVFPVLRTSKACRLPESLMMLNSLVNPLIYFYRDRRLRNAALELLRFKKPAAVHPEAVGAASKPAGRKDPPGSLEAAQKQQKAKNGVLSKGAPSCGPTVLSNCCIDGSGNSRGKIPERSFPVLMLDKCSGSVDGLQLQHHSSLEETAVRRSEAMQPAVGQKDSFALLETVQKRLKAEQQASFKRPKSSNRIVPFSEFSIDCCGKYPGTLLKRSLSVSMLDKCSGCVDGLQVQQPSSVEVTTARRSEAMRPVVSVAQPVGNKDAFGSLATEQNWRKAAQSDRFNRPRSCNRVVPASKSPTDRVEKPRGVFLKGSMSLPMLDECTSSLDGLRLQQSSPMVLTTAIIHPESGGRTAFHL